ncbi:AraC family transcriptional regulator [Mucilaginibacter angelicae]|uniref:AraC family transcriptional regulator n=1 Tax=Mucilaginibacter angelicae TaxID=869718 RepID=A0ABV6L365_9SPHI
MKKKTMYDNTYAENKVLTIDLTKDRSANFLSDYHHLFQLIINQIGFVANGIGHSQNAEDDSKDHVLVYCLEGKGNCTFDNKTYKVKANQYFILPAMTVNRRYWADPVQPWTIYWINFQGHKIDQFNELLQLDIYSGPVSIPFNEKGIEIWHSIYDILKQGTNLGNLCNSNFRLYNFLATFLFPEDKKIKSEANDRNLANHTIKQMLNSLSKKIFVGDMAKQQNLSVSRFSKLFKQATGMAPNEYFIYLRMQKACELLDDEETRIKEVAINLGYNDPLYFSKLFKRHIGLSPENYRLAAKLGSIADDSLKSTG